MEYKNRRNHDTGLKSGDIFFLTTLPQKLLEMEDKKDPEYMRVKCACWRLSWKRFESWWRWWWRARGERPAQAKPKYDFLPGLDLDGFLKTYINMLFDNHERTPQATRCNGSRFLVNCDECNKDISVGFRVTKTKRPSFSNTNICNCRCDKGRPDSRDIRWMAWSLRLLVSLWLSWHFPRGLVC